LESEEILVTCSTSSARVMFAAPAELYSSSS
jgi:hypothetical protein